MKTLTHKRPPVPVETTGFEQLMERISLRHNLGTTLNNILFNIITFFIEDDVSEENWALIAARYQWENMEEIEFLMSLVDLVKNYKDEHILIDGILSSNKLRFPEFERILENVRKGKTINLYAVDMVVSKVLDVAIYHNQVEKGESLVAKFMNATIAFLDRNNNLDALQEIAETYEWNQLDIKLLRVIAFWACGEECRYVILQKIIEAKKLHLCDLVTIAGTVQHPRIKWVLRYALSEASIVSSRKEYGRDIINAMFPPKPQGSVNSLTACEKLGCENCGMATNNINGTVCRLLQ